MKKELKKYVEGRSIEEWIQNDDKRAFWALPQEVKDEICERADGRPDGNLQWWSNCRISGGKQLWECTNINPVCSSGTTFRINGARKLEDTPPEGMRVATEQERNDNDPPTMPAGSSYWFFWRDNGEWRSNKGTITGGWKDLEHYAYAIPADYVFPKLEDTPPDGWKLVPDDMAHHVKNGDYMFFNNQDERWSVGTNNHEAWNRYADRYAVRDSYQFPKPWEIAPEGYRIVTEEEINRHGGLIVPCHQYYSDSGGGWCDMEGESEYPMCNNHHFKAYAVPNDFTFEPEVVEISHEEASKQLAKSYPGKTVKIVVK